jgi:hypothetical protein
VRVSAHYCSVSACNTRSAELTCSPTPRKTSSLPKIAAGAKEAMYEDHTGLKIVAFLADGVEVDSVGVGSGSVPESPTLAPV